MAISLQSSVVVVAAVLTICLLHSVPSASAIRCFECNSHNDTRCAQDIPPQDLSIECGDRQQGVKFTFCRKIKQVIETSVNNMPADTRIIRNCGWDDSTYKNKCYHRSGYGGRQEVCACESDNCNAAGSIRSTWLMPIAAAVAVSALLARSTVLA